MNRARDADGGAERPRAGVSELKEHRCDNLCCWAPQGKGLRSQCGDPRLQQGQQLGIAGLLLTALASDDGTKATVFALAGRAGRCSIFRDCV